jgi:hypothetical protein
MYGEHETARAFAPMPEVPPWFLRKS